MTHLQAVALVLLAAAVCLASKVSRSDPVNSVRTNTAGDLKYREKWGYVNVRPAAHMFWWLYYASSATRQQRPLVMWLQGGPGGSGTGFGNFQEIGPKFINGSDRSSTWLQTADLLFVDNPVGTGFSYVDNENAFTTTTDEIVQDLLVCLRGFLETNPDYKSAPFYVFSESYGGKMTAAFGVGLHKAIESGQLQSNFQGVALGDSWISPIDYVLSYGPFLYMFSFLDENSLTQLNEKAAECKDLVDQARWSDATDCWSDDQGLVAQLAANVDWYNVLTQSDSGRRRANRSSFRQSVASIKDKRVASLYRRLMEAYQDDDLDKYMNTVIRKKLKVIPSSVVWGGQSSDVFSNQQASFMQPVIESVDFLLANTTLKVAIYNGQLDLICDTFGTENWVEKLRWKGLPSFKNAARVPFLSPQEQDVAGFSKKFEELSFYWILRAGHMAPADAPLGTLSVLQDILEN